MAGAADTAAVLFSEPLSSFRSSGRPFMNNSQSGRLAGTWNFSAGLWRWGAADADRDDRPNSQGYG